MCSSFLVLESGVLCRFLNTLGYYVICWGGGFDGGDTAVTNNITINQQPGQSTDELASIVALKIGEAVADARAASVLV